MTITLILPAQADSDKLREIQKKHRAAQHEENKKWRAMEEDCRKKFPKHYDTTHGDYDAHFKCREGINVFKDAFEDKHNKELCEKLKIKCKKEEKPEKDLTFLEALKGFQNLPSNSRQHSLKQLIF